MTLSTNNSTSVDLLLASGDDDGSEMEVSPIQPVGSRLPTYQVLESQDEVLSALLEKILADMEGDIVADFDDHRSRLAGIIHLVSQTKFKEVQHGTALRGLLAKEYGAEPVT